VGGAPTVSAVYPVFEDARGRLVPVEFADVPFEPRRAFVVVAPDGGATRGDHVSTCTELLVLVAGEARIRLGPGADDGTRPTTRRMRSGGQSCVVERGQHVVYDLGEGAVLLVLADREYEP
jgi:hypothetical protein